MSSETNEIKTYFGRCRCCLNYGYLKNMWEVHYWEGVKEIYVEMLVQCFALSWEQSEDSKENDQICESCIKRLRDAFAFKKIILESQEELLEMIDDASEGPVKMENVDYTLGYKEKAGNRSTDERIYIDDPDDPDYVDPDDPEVANHPADSNAMEYEEVEYLEDDDNREALAAQENTQTGPRSSTPTVGSDGKWPRKLPKAERYKTYKQYTEEDLRKCLEAIREGELTTPEASEKYNIPKKTICAKIKIDPKGQFNDPYKTVNKEKMYQLIQEVKTILTYTNATPYKSKANRYYCAYCSTDGPHFDDPDELRTHTRTQHASDRTAKIEYCMRPHWMNETIKMDIDNLLCTVCSTSIGSWNDMFRHFKDQHKIVMDQAYTRAIPYLLRSELQCALCKESFGNYMHLDGHMNAHYSNHVCDDCGDTFLAANRLKQHIKIHDIGKFACSICPKVFTLDKYKKKHEESVHKHLSKYKCWYCDEKFTAEYIRHVHTVEKHKEKVKTITCEFCGKTFTWRPYYVAHKKKKHVVDAKKFGCDECDKKFFSQFELKEHKLRHTGVKHFPCHICQKRYISSGSLKHHLNWHKRNEAVDE